MPKRRDYKPEYLECIICGTGFIPKNQVQVTCNKLCAKKLATIRTRAWRTNRGGATLPASRECPVCNTSFPPTTANNKFCSLVCAKVSRSKQVSEWQMTVGKGRRLERVYGITIQEYEEMVKNQKGKCLICHTKTTKLVVDHNHTTSKVRGLLCQKCNSALGIFKDSKVILQSAINYLERCDG